MVPGSTPRTVIAPGTHLLTSNILVASKNLFNGHPREKIFTPAHPTGRRGLGSPSRRCMTRAAMPTPLNTWPKPDTGGRGEGRGLFGMKSDFLSPPILPVLRSQAALLHGNQTFHRGGIRVGNGGDEMRVPRPTLLAPIRGAGSPGRVCVCLTPTSRRCSEPSTCARTPSPVCPPRGPGGGGIAVSTPRFLFRT